MKKLPVVAGIILGFMFLMASIPVLFHLMKMPHEADAQSVYIGLWRKPELISRKASSITRVVTGDRLQQHCRVKCRSCHRTDVICRE